MKNDLISKIFMDKMNIIHCYLIKLGCNQEDAEDITQDTFYKALKYIDGIDVSQISSWLFRVAINRYYDLCRTKKRHVQVIINEEIFKSDNNLCEDYIIDLERKGDVLKILNSLNNIQKNLLILKYNMDLSYKEISNILDINESTVKTYLFRARAQFKNKWGVMYNE
ncbi:RNA polymerase sigma factor [Clostridium estertheticum]|uniref:RNA polymerase subunit sigma-70 n=2 Tax=Clostridium estertheticum TaxID=238834 RepID=A0A1J0GGP5_9CLOT|nr:RNA polymerase sigma factor [Clostridium estertheticum]APC40538.1 RNA polymerase subunit sigma-70 [Clostridium estertheticum subsp. estertheticum]MBU3173826.1 RNA polymerase sigma factor [Clostridium estertheticum]MBW9173186.1 RNA polymerase sigma factor [Clostridium estertheticum]MBX4266937.1 RNA polymerase sigma factor [Clostridium estertheticum]MBZ9617642.1 RNA polymerase sigma factor [Clostridium estertheticum subsp. laramiense]